MWYRIFKTANRENYLRELGASEEIINYIMSLEEKHSQVLTNEFRKNPRLTLLELQGVKKPNRPQPITQTEMATISDNVPEFLSNRNKLWLAYQIRKDSLGSFKDGQLDILSHIQAIRGQISHLNITGFWDWVRFNNVDLTGYPSLTDAMVKNNEWHIEIAKDGEGSVYQESEIFYGPKWNDKEGNEKEEYRGWTIREIKTKNDLEVEGNQMGHCCGSYWSSVYEKIMGAYGESRIFSLRDPGNKPHVTIETDVSGKEAFQIQGKENHEPIDKYKEMIKFWITQGGSPITTYGDDDALYEELQYYPVYGFSKYVEGVEEALRSGGETDYGTKVSTDYEHLLNYAFEQSWNAMTHYNSRSHSYTGDQSLSDYIVSYAVETGDKFISQLLRLMEEKNDEAYESFDMYLDLPYPFEGDFENDEGEFNQEEYDKAVEKYQEEYERHSNENWPIAWANEWYKVLIEELKEKKNMTLQEFVNMESEQKKEAHIKYKVIKL
jgi:hypothetical protein